MQPSHLCPPQPKGNKKISLALILYFYFKNHNKQYSYINIFSYILKFRKEVLPEKLLNLFQDHIKSNDIPKQSAKNEGIQNFNLVRDPPHSLPVEEARALQSSPLFER